MYDDCTEVTVKDDIVDEINTMTPTPDLVPVEDRKRTKRRCYTVPVLVEGCQEDDSSDDDEDL